MTQSASHPSIEPWQLTAYALNELEPSDAAKVELALETDVALRREFEQIQQTLTAVRTAFASTAVNVGLSDSQTAVVSGQIEQMAAPNASVASALPAVATIKLAGRPFYRRKRFAALLATAAAIPLAATWMPSLYENGGPFALHGTGSTVLSTSPSGNAGFSRETDSSVAAMEGSSASVKADGGNVQSKDPVFSKSHEAIMGAPSSEPNGSKLESGKINLNTTELGNKSDALRSLEESNIQGEQQGDFGVSFVPEMGLAIVKGSKQDVEKAEQAISGTGGKNEIASASSIDAAERRLHNSDSFNNNTIDEKVVAPARGGIDPSKLSVTPRLDISEEAELGDKESSKLEGMTSGNLGDAKIGDPVSSGKANGQESLQWPEAKDWADLSKRRVVPNEGSPRRSVREKKPSGDAEILRTKLDDIALTEMKNSEYARGGKVAGKDSYGAGGMGIANPAGSSEGMPTSDRMLAVTETIATHDKRLRDFESLPLQQLPEELRANAPHLFRREAKEPTGTDRFEKIVETPFLETQKAPLSTFSIDVDTASYSKIRQTIMEGNRLPSPNMVRIEEMVNYFEYGYEGPQDERPFAAHMSVDRCPWNTEHQLVRVGLQAKKIDKDKRVKANIVFLLDVSGSMNEPNKLPLVKKSLSMMVNQLNENDRVAIVVYAGAAGCVLPSTCGAEKHAILSSLDHLNAGGSTNGGQGIQLAYSIAKEHFIPGGANRVVLCTDGDFNVGVTGDDALVAMMQENAKSNIFLTCLGFGAGNYNDTMMEKISNKGNGIYGMIDNELEGRRMMVEQLGGTLVTVAKDVKIQVDFNPAKVAGYRLIGYEDRRLANKDFDNDQKDAGRNWGWASSDGSL